MFKPKTGDVLQLDTGILLIIIDSKEPRDSYTWRFLPGSKTADLYKTNGTCFDSHETSHAGLGAYSVLFNIFDDINWEALSEKIAPRRT